MKQFKYLLFLVFVSFVFSTNVFALCNDSSLNDWAEEADIKFEEDYDTELVDSNGQPIGVHKKEFYYVLLVYPNTDKIYAKVKTNLSDKEEKYEFNKDWGTISIGSLIHQERKKYTITLYGSKDSACPDEKLKTLTYEMPPFNRYTLTTFCMDYQWDDICRINTDTSSVTQKEFEKYVEKVKNEEKLEKMNTGKKILFYIKEYWMYVVIPIILISIFYIVKIVLYKKKVEKE